MSFNNLDRIVALFAIKSNSDLGGISSTKLNKTDYQNAAGAMAWISKHCDRNAAHAANIYCFDNANSFLTLRFLLHAKALEWLRRDKRRNMSKGLELVDIALKRAFTRELDTITSQAKALGMTKQAYSETWLQYVRDLVVILEDLLTAANIEAGAYFLAESKQR